MIEYDKIEDSNEYKDAMKVIQPQLDEMPKNISYENKMLFKQKELNKRGIAWKTPMELNPDIIFN